jgi:hypothetical protein
MLRKNFCELIHQGVWFHRNGFLRVLKKHAGMGDKGQAGREPEARGEAREHVVRPLM